MNDGFTYWVYLCVDQSLCHVSPEKVCEIYNQQNKKKLNLSEIEQYIQSETPKIENRYVYIYQGKFLEENFYLLEEQYKELVAKQKDKPYYIPVKEELLKYAELSYWEKPAEFVELETYIQASYFPGNQKLSRNLANEIFEHIQMGSIKEVVEIFEHYEIIFKDETESDSILYIIQRLHNNTRMKANNGYTPFELSVLTGNPSCQVHNLV